MKPNIKKLRKLLRRLNRVWYKMSAFGVTIMLVGMVKDYYNYRWLSIEGLLIALAFLGFYLYQCDFLEEALFKILRNQD